MESQILTLFMGNNQLLSLFILMLIYCPRVNQWEFLQIGCMLYVFDIPPSFRFLSTSYFMALQDAPSSSCIFPYPSPGISHFTKFPFSTDWYSETKVWLYLFSLLMECPLFLSPPSRQSWQKDI